MNSPLTVPGAEPSLSLAGPVACLLLHGFTSQPEEMRFLAEDLHRRGYTVLNVRLAGHGTHPLDLARTRWTDWLLSVEENLNLLSGVSKHVVLIGQSMGGMIALTAAASYPVTGVVALSTPFGSPPAIEMFLTRFLGLLGTVARKNAPEHPDLGQRREANYPAYSRYPLRILPELEKLQKAMQKALPQVRVPALVVQSHQDMGGRDDLEQIYSRLGSARKGKIWLDNFDHSVVQDEKRAIVFDAIAEFLQKLG